MPLTTKYLTTIEVKKEKEKKTRDHFIITFSIREYEIYLSIYSTAF